MSSIAPDIAANARPLLKPRRLIPLIGALQCVYILDFMLILPLGPDLAAALGFRSNQVGWLTAAYTLASLSAGLFAVPLLDRFDRRQALLASLAGLTLALIACALAQDFSTLLFARAAAGLSAAPTIASGMAILIDHTPPPQRGSAIAKVMIGFSLATIGGIPLGLELATRCGWQSAFLVVALLAALVGAAASRLLPAQTQHLLSPPNQHGAIASRQSPLALLKRRSVQIASLLLGLNQFAAFLVVPSFSAFYLLNLGFPREQLGLLYLAGGVVALFAMQLAGRTTDKRGPWLPVLIASICFCLGLLPFCGIHALPITLCFVLFMAGNAARSVCLASSLSQIPAPQERAGFMALQKMVQDLGVSLAAGASALLLGSVDGPLTHTTELAGLTMLGALGVLGLLAVLQRKMPRH
ncbi:MFS transporter [Uliginosibacterium sediminicola]|uniref:MFS transporter n=1 Tax=Uliginosibacterium sediminicola TaxID=2024550 RepID=A0ABU9Z2Y2_9RHOO